MIVHARVDERLIHGQVAMVWTNTVGATRIVVVNDEAVKDEMMISALKIAKPAGVKLSLLSIEKAKIKLNDDTYAQDRVFLICKNIKDMITLVDEVDQLKSFNVGNVSQKQDTINIKKSVNLTQDEIDILKKLVEKGIYVTAQMVPNESDQLIVEYFNY